MGHQLLMFRKSKYKIEMYKLKQVEPDSLIVLPALKKWCLISLIIILHCKLSFAQQTTKNGYSESIGVWEVIGDTMIVWSAHKESILTINFVYLPKEPKRQYSESRIQFTLIDSSITPKEYKDFDILNTEHRFLIPPNFNLISPQYRRRSFKFSQERLTFRSIHDLNCESDSTTTDQLTYELYTGNFTKQKYIYTFSTEGIGDAIRQIACNK